MFKSISTFVVNSYFFKGFYTLLAISVFSIIGLGIYALHTSPYTGILLSIDNDKWIINRNDLSNPDNSSDIAVGDRVDYLGNILIEKDDFIRLPEFFSKKLERQWWAKQKSFFELLQNSNSLNLRVNSKTGKKKVVTANVLPCMPLHQIIKRNIFIYLSGIFAVGIGGISLFRRPSSPLNILCAFFSVFGALYLVSVAPVSNRDLTLQPLLFYTLILGCYIGTGGMITLVHFSLLFPRPNLILTKHPNIIYFLYIYPFITFTFYLSGICAMGAFFPFVIIWILIIVYAFFNSWMSEKDILLKKLISISLIIPVSCSLVFVFIFLLPTFIGLPPLDANYFALISLLIPFSLFFCIENYHLYNEKTKSEEERQRERQNIISDLHDELGNDLTNIKMFCEVIPNYLSSDRKKVEEYVADIKETSRNSMDQLRDFLYSIDTKEVTWHDLISKFKEYASSILEPKAIKLNFHYSLDGNISDPRTTLKYHLFRIYKEALGNIIKHAEAANVNITITTCEKEITMKIKDDGIGFEMLQKPNDGHYGIGNMNKRVKAINGVFKLETLNDIGTVINPTIPIG